MLRTGLEFGGASRHPTTSASIRYCGPGIIEAFVNFYIRKSGDTLLISPSHCRELANPELKVCACPIGCTFFDELCLIMIGVSIDY